MLPALIHDSLTTTFNFYHNNRIHQGLICQNRMHVMIKAFDRDQRGYAMALALKLSHTDVQPLITVSSCANYYRVWVDLQSHDSEYVQSLLSGNWPKVLQDDFAGEMVGSGGAIA